MTGSLSAEHGDIVVGVLGEVADTTIKAQRGSVDLLAGAQATNLKITADHSFLSLPDDPHDPADQHVTVFVAGNLDGTIRARHSADIETIGGTDNDQNSTPGNVDLKVKVSAGPIDVMSGGALAGTFKATGDVTASAMGAASGLYRSSESNVSLSTVAAINATVKGEGTATVFAGETINGLIRGGTTAQVTSGDNMDATVKAGTDADVMVVGGSLGGDVTAAKGAATVTVTGGVIAASITGRTQVDAWTQDGIQSGTLSTSAGPVNVTSMGDILSDAEINAHGGDATVYGNTTVAGLIYSTQNTHVTAMAGSAADVIAELNVDLFAGGDSAGYVWAGNNADVTVTGSVTGDVTADIANAQVSANGSITSIIDAGQQATVSALGPITGGSITTGVSASVTTWAELGSTITAAQNADAWAYGAISGNITAGNNVTAFAQQDVAAIISAGQVATVTAMAWVGGHVTAGTDAFVTAYGDIGGVVDAGVNADVFAMGNITGGTISAGTGDVDAMAFGDITSILIAGSDVDGFAMGDMSIGLVSAGANADLVAMGANAQLMLVDAGGNANITSFGTLVAPAVTASGDADLFAMGATVATISATNASVFSDSDVESNITATADASAIAMGSSLKTIMTVGGDGYAYTAGSITASLIDADGAASMIALTQIANSTVDGDTDAFAMSGSDVTLANVLSANGPASLVGTGNIANTTLNAGTDASLVAIGNVSTTNITAAASVSALSQGNMTGTTIDADGNVAVASYGTLQLDNVEAGGNVSLASVGNLTANVQAQGTLEASTFGDLDGTYLIEDDIIELIARGNITGSYTSHDNIDKVFTWEGINADLTAGGLANPVDANGDGYGKIRKVRAWKQVDGVLSAEEVEDVEGGEEVAATMPATVGGVTSGSRDAFAGWPEPRPARLGSLDSEIAEMRQYTQYSKDARVAWGVALSGAQNGVVENAKTDATFTDQVLDLAHSAVVALDASEDDWIAIVVVDAANEAAWIDVGTTAAVRDNVRLRMGTEESYQNAVKKAFSAASSTSETISVTVITGCDDEVRAGNDTKASAEAALDWARQYVKTVVKIGETRAEIEGLEEQRRLSLAVAATASVSGAPGMSSGVWGVGSSKLAPMTTEEYERRLTGLNVRLQGYEQDLGNYRRILEQKYADVELPTIERWLWGDDGHDIIPADFGPDGALRQAFAEASRPETGYPGMESVFVQDFLTVYFAGQAAYKSMAGVGGLGAKTQQAGKTLAAETVDLYLEQYVPVSPRALLSGRADALTALGDALPRGDVLAGNRLRNLLTERKGIEFNEVPDLPQLAIWRGIGKVDVRDLSDMRRIEALEEYIHNIQMKVRNARGGVDLRQLPEEEYFFQKAGLEIEAHEFLIRQGVATTPVEAVALKARLEFWRNRLNDAQAAQKACLNLEDQIRKKLDSGIWE